MTTGHAVWLGPPTRERLTSSTWWVPASRPYFALWFQGCGLRGVPEQDATIDMTVVYFWVPDVDHAAGGIRTVYRLVDACNAAGIAAAVMHQRSGFRASWFENSSRVVAAQDVRVTGSDVLVISELDAPGMLDAAPGVTKVVLNQHQYWTFVGGPVDYRHQDVAQVISVSEDGVRYLSKAFPGLTPARLRCAVDTSLFRPRGEQRDRSVVFLGGKGAGSRAQVLAMLANSRVAANWKLEALAGLSQEQLADRLSTAAVLASFSEFEGFQMLLTEAMASGCAVVGFAAGGGIEYLTEEVAWPVAASDIVGFVERLEEVLALYDTEPEAVEHRTRAAVELVRQRYTLANEAGDIVAALQPALDRARGGVVTQSFDVQRQESGLQTTLHRVRQAARAFVKG